MVTIEELMVRLILLIPLEIYIVTKYNLFREKFELSKICANLRQPVKKLLNFPFLWPFNWLWENQSIVIRILFCWAIGLFLLVKDSSDHFDARFKYRNLQSISENIVILTLSQEHWSVPERVENEANQDFFVGNLDEMYWDEENWYFFLQKILDAKPQAIGISFYFGGVKNESLDVKQKKIFTNPKIFWASRLDPEGQILLPGYSSMGVQTGVINLKPDGDGIFRRLSTPPKSLLPFDQKLASGSLRQLAKEYKAREFINFRGASGSFPRFSLTDFLEGRISKKIFENRIVIIGAEDVDLHRILTPQGFMGRAEVLANILDNKLEKRWIKKTNIEFYGLLILGVILLSCFFVMNYAQVHALSILICLGGYYSLVSYLSFNIHYFWLPLGTPLISMILSFVVFLSYRLSFNERKSWELAREQKNINELEELKDNFISLMSHDLKTPIAKIQAIVDRLMIDLKEDSIKKDLEELKNSSQDLHHYIKSILRLSRVEARNFQIKKETYDINELLSRSVKRVSRLAEKKQLEIQMDLEPLFSIEVDPDANF